MVTTEAPGAGPLTLSTDLHTPAPVSATARSRAFPAFAARNAQVGPEPEMLLPRVQGAAQVRAQRHGGGLQVVTEQRADLGRVAGAQRGHQRHAQPGAPTVAADSRVRGRLTPLKDLKGRQSPEQLKRLVAQISEKPESVQHHTVDQNGLDSLLEQLAKKPGIHAVHLSKGGKAKVVPGDGQLG